MHLSFQVARGLWLRCSISGVLLSLATTLPAGTGGKVSATMSPADVAALHSAMDAYDQGQTAAAEPILSRLVHAYPGSYPALEALGSLYVETSRTAKAVPLLEKAAALGPSEPVAHANLGAAYVAVGRAHDAVHELRRATELNPADAGANSNLAHALLLDHQPAAAAKAFGRAAELAAPGNDLLYNWALALLEAGETQPASAVLGRIPSAGMSDEAHGLAADLEERQGHFQPALAHLQAAAQINPSDANLYALVLELLRHWTWNAASEVARYGAQRYPQSTHFEVAEGIARYGANDYKGAVPIFAALLAQDPENGAVADLLGRNCSQLTDGEESSCDGVYTFARHHPANAVMSTYAAVAILHRPENAQDLGEAESLLRSAIAADPKYAPAYFQLGVLEQIQLHWADSASALEQAVALQPTSPEAHYRLSRAYVHLGMRDKAEAQLQLQQSYAKQAKTMLDAKLQEVVTFLLQPK